MVRAADKDGTRSRDACLGAICEAIGISVCRVHFDMIGLVIGDKE